MDFALQVCPETTALEASYHSNREGELLGREVAAVERTLSVPDLGILHLLLISCSSS
jgi:hypothetical protein